MSPQFSGMADFHRPVTGAPCPKCAAARSCDHRTVEPPRVAHVNMRSEAAKRGGRPRKSE